MSAPILHHLTHALALGLLACGCRATQPAGGSLEQAVPGAAQGRAAADEIHRMLDDWHLAASRADAEDYLEQLATEASFLGTDATERSDREGFAAYVTRNFSGPNPGWTYQPRDRSIDFGPGGEVAWFDELLERDGFAVVRGTGVVVREGGRWRIAQYNMAYTVPNGVAKDVLPAILAYRRGER